MVCENGEAFPGWTPRRAAFKNRFLTWYFPWAGRSACLAARLPVPGHFCTPHRSEFGLALSHQPLRHDGRIVDTDTSRDAATSTKRSKKREVPLLQEKSIA